MMVFRALLVVCLSGFINACSSVYDVQYDYDLKADFTDLNSYDWLPAPDETDVDSLNATRIKRAVNAEMQAKGLTITSDSPAFFIVAHSRTQDRISVRDWGYSYDPFESYWSGQWGTEGISRYEYTEGSLILDFVDAGTKKMIWRGTAKAALDDQSTPEEKALLISEAVQKILKNFPPPAAN